MTNFYYEKFRSWLVNQEQDAVAGTRGSVCDCPIARYLRSDGAVHIEVYAAWIYYRYPEMTELDEMETPDWGVRFINLVDGDGVYPVDKITVHECLGILEVCR